MHDLKQTAEDLLNAAKAELVEKGETTVFVVFIKHIEPRIIKINAEHLAAALHEPARFDIRLALLAASIAAHDAKADAILFVAEGYSRKLASLDELEHYRRGQLAVDPDATEGLSVFCKTRDHDGDFIIVQQFKKNDLGEIEWLDRQDSDGNGVIDNLIPDFND